MTRSLAFLGFDMIVADLSISLLLIKDELIVILFLLCEEHLEKHLSCHF